MIIEPSAFKNGTRNELEIVFYSKEDEQQASCVGLVIFRLWKTWDSTYIKTKRRCFLSRFKCRSLKLLLWVARESKITQKASRLKAEVILALISLAKFLFKNTFYLFICPYLLRAYFSPFVKSFALH